MRFFTLIGVALGAAACSGHDDTPHVHAPSAREVAGIEAIELKVEGAAAFDSVRAFRRRAADGGQARRIIIVPGAPSDVAYWGGAMALLDPSADVYAIERPGYNGSGGDRAVRDLDEQVKAIGPLVADYSGPVILVGHSYGASVVLAALERYREKIAGVVLASPYVFPVSGRRRLRFEAVRWSPLRYVGGAATDHFFAEVAAQRAQSAGLIRTAAQSCTPMLIVHGEADDIIPIADAERLNALVPPCAGARIEKIAGGDHFLSVHAADALAQAVNSFLARLLTDLFRF
jgi:pimeloyl-ACP methyl ester carboxylesterase